MIVGTLVPAFAAALHWAYESQVQAFAYLGYTYRQPIWAFVVISVIALVALALILPWRIKGPSSLVLWVLYVLVAVPSAQVPLYSRYLEPNAALGLAFAIIGCFVLVRLLVARSRPPRRLPIHLTARAFWIVVAVFSLIVYVILGVTFGLQLRFVGVLDVYDIRGDYEARLVGSSAIVTYLISAQANVVNPIIIARGITRSNVFLVLLGALGQALIFSSTGFKTILFSLPAIILASLIFLTRRPAGEPRFHGTPRGAVLVGGAIGTILVCLLLDALSNGIIWTSLFVRRFIVTPGLMSGIYTDFYSDNPHAHLAHSVLAPWVDSEYRFAPAKTIGLWITGSTDTSMNANLLADGFANFGWAGMFGAALILGIYLRVADSVSFGLPPIVPSLVMLVLAITISNTSILTSMFTHGLVAAVIVLALAPRGGWESPTPGLWSARMRRFASSAGSFWRRPETRSKG